MSEVLGIVPARIGSKGIPHKNFKVFEGGMTPLGLAIQCADEAGIGRVVVSTDCERQSIIYRGVEWLYAPAPLHTDTCAMIDVVKDVLARVPGPPEQIICLLQPTQVLRKPEHITQAIALLTESGADSVVSVVELPLTHSPDMVMGIVYRCWPELRRWWECPEYVDSYVSGDWECSGWSGPQRRQDARPAYIRDGTCYAFRRSTVTKYGNIYGEDVRPLIIDPADTCPLDTEADWREADRRLRDREGVQA